MLPRSQARRATEKHIPSVVSSLQSLLADGHPDRDPGKSTRACSCDAPHRSHRHSPHGGFHWAWARELTACLLAPRIQMLFVVGWPPTGTSRRLSTSFARASHAASGPVLDSMYARSTFDISGVVQPSSSSYAIREREASQVRASVRPVRGRTKLPFTARPGRDSCTHFLRMRARIRAHLRHLRSAACGEHAPPDARAVSASSCVPLERAS